MTWLRCAIYGLAVLFTLGSAAASAQAVAVALQGTWVRVGDPYRTKVRLHIGRESMTAELGCSVTGYVLTADGGKFQVREAGLTIENPCDRCEGYRGGWAYWDEVDYQIVASTDYALAGDQLTLSSPRRAMTFTRAYPRPGGGWVVPGDPDQGIDPSVRRRPSAKASPDREDCDALPRRVIP
jgi:hypothetical protein